MINMSTPSNIKTGVIGSGLMGTDILYYLSDFDFNLVWICLGEEEQSRIQSAYSRKAERLFRNGLIDEKGLHHKKDQVLISSSIRDLHDCGIIIESIQENAADKARLFIDLAKVLAKDAVVVTNTSSIKPSLLIRDEEMKKHFAGLHFFYPVKMKNIVELIVTDFTDEKTITVLRNFISAMDRFHLEMHEDEAFILNRLFLDFQAQAFRLHHDDGLDMKAIDAIIKKNMFPVGVFEFFDLVGIDIMRQSIINYIDTMAGRDFYMPLIDCFDELISQKKIGRKSGAGFYNYPDNDPGVSLPDDGARTEIVALLQSMYINSVFRAFEKNIWSRVNLEFAVKEYMGVEKGPFTLADEMGHAAIKELLQHYYNKTGFDAYRPSLLL